MSIDKTDFYQNLQVDNQRREASKAKSNDELGKDEFMKLLITQLENQDPLEPTDNTEFIAQLAQFSSLEGISNMSASLEGFGQTLASTQALQASTLVGRQVQVLADYTNLEEGKPVKGTIDLPQSSQEVFVAVYTGGGEYIGDIGLGSRDKGEVAFEWDGLDTDGEPFPPGNYQFRAFAYQDGKPEQQDLYLARNVSSVALNSGRSGGDIMLNISGMDKPVALKDVKVIN
ncbi:flagellar basal-body rod modification protein FlgD [Marinospirillum celere]|uniref:Basal-body rod modification protein FlgD n=1 Tax=Marinospirillum celere TaxID=1122252 RepID=A0A1I1HAY7_9GAMM|nr:flagellar hook assembly protein FlgD [Marinospirillum celere]SFC20885.1 flagellar basal-body rod modification protein FlgD [Marinospirillum celere]